MGAPEALRRLEEGIEIVRKFAHPKISDAVTIEGVGTCSDELTTGAAQLARDAESLFVLHKATSEQEVALELRAFGHRPVEHMAKTDALNPYVLMNHVTTQTGKWPELLAAGVPLALGTDAENQSNHQDICRAMTLAALLPRDARRDPRAVTAEQAVEMATIGGATALRLEEATGSLTVGKEADLTIFDIDDFDWRPLHNPVANLVYGVTGYSVDTVVIGGVVVLDHKVHTMVDIDALRDEVEAVDRKILRSIGVEVTPAWPVVDRSRP
jgi:cytosine/adenosine deaminase-related metal-dependent hydrolase